MKISASIYARASVGDARTLEATVRALDAHRVDYLHVDCADDPAVFEDIRRIRTWSTTPIDLHLIAADPRPYYPLLRELNVELVSVQAENLQQPLAPPADLAPRFGWACTADTPIEAFAEWQEQLNGGKSGQTASGFVLFMATTPGKSGGRFDARTFRRIRDFRRRFPGVPVHVDGGVDEEVGFILRNHGVRAAVTGSFILAQDPSPYPSPGGEYGTRTGTSATAAQQHGLGARLVALHKAEPLADQAYRAQAPDAQASDAKAPDARDTDALGSGKPSVRTAAQSGSRFRVADFMLQTDELPLLPWPQENAAGTGPLPDFAALLRCIETHALGFALLQKPDGRLAGLVSNADVRRALLRHLDDLNRVQVADCINPHPFCARSGQSVPELLRAVKACPFPVAYCPVLDAEDRLVGALPFNNLIKGEA